MKNDKTTDNRRILVIDDNVSIHEDFRKILVPPKDSDSLDQARVALFGETPSLPPQEHYELEFARQGQEGRRSGPECSARGPPLRDGFRGHAYAAGMGRPRNDRASVVCRS